MTVYTTQQNFALGCRGGPESNLTRAQSKASGCGYMGVALCVGFYKHDLVNVAQLSTRLCYLKTNS